MHTLEASVDGSWLADCWLAGCWLAAWQATGTPGSEGMWSGEGKTFIPGGTQQPACKIRSYKTTRIQDYKLRRLRKDFKATDYTT